MFGPLVDLIHRGGPVMWPLLALSLVSTTLLLERAWFWVRTNHGARLARVRQLHRLLQRGDRAGARVLAESDASVYGRVTLRLLDGEVNDALAVEIIESERAYLERYLPTLNTTITVAPLLGLLGTVIGLITTFRLMSPQQLSDPKLAGVGLAEALINTAAGLVIAIVVLFPYNAYRAQVDHTLGRIEALIAAAGAAADKATVAARESDAGAPAPSRGVGSSGGSPHVGRQSDPDLAAAPPARVKPDGQRPE